MEKTRDTQTPQGGLIAAIAVLILLIGAALDNALALLGMSITALVVIGVFHRQMFGRNTLLVTLIAAVTAAVVGFTITRL